MNDKISEKAVWDELVPSEDEKISSASFGQSAQAQMMFCYKCNQVIPANSAFCPWCQTELFVTCSKCGNKYSSQYPACNQCGTNREAYMQELKRLEAKRIEEERIRNERIKEQQRIDEEKRRERERLERIEQEKRSRSQSIAQEQLRKRFISEDQEIIETIEYRKAKEFLSEFEVYYDKQAKSNGPFWAIGWMLVILAVICAMWLLFEITITSYLSSNTSIIGLCFGVIGAGICFFAKDIWRDSNIGDYPKHFRNFVQSHVVDNDIKHIINSAAVLIDEGWGEKSFGGTEIFEKQRDFIILSYRKAYNKEFELYTSLMDKYSVK